MLEDDADRSRARPHAPDGAGARASGAARRDRHARARRGRPGRHDRRGSGRTVRVVVPRPPGHLRHALGEHDAARPIRVGAKVLARVASRAVRQAEGQVRRLRESPLRRALAGRGAPPPRGTSDGRHLPAAGRRDVLAGGDRPRRPVLAGRRRCPARRRRRAGRSRARRALTLRRRRASVDPVLPTRSRPERAPSPRCC